MRVNSRVFTERTDMLEGIQIPNCPSQFKVIAERLVMLVSKPGYSVGEYHTMTELDKILMISYWREYDGLDFMPDIDTFKIWFIRHATEPELIRRARQFLVEKNYFILPEDIRQHAQEAGDKFRVSVRGKK